MDLKAFLGRVLPSSGGNYFGAISSVQGPLQQSAPLDSVEDLAKYITNNIKTNNTYVAIGTYDTRRDIKHAQFKRALYLDLDCGEDKGFTGKQEAITELSRFCKATSLPLPNIIVDSGHGVHCYWSFDTDITVNEWQPLANALRSLCEANDFKIDPSITTDAARILRVPGSVNFKDPAHPIETKILRFKNAFTVDDIRNVLNNSLPAKTDEIADDLSAGFEYAKRKYWAGRIAERCNALAYTIQTGGANQPGMLWHRLIHLLAYTEDGRDYIHGISKGHDTYSPEVTERRYVYALKRKDEGIGPTLCQTISQYLPSKCDECQFKNRIKTPLVLGLDDNEYLPANYRIANDGVYKLTYKKGDDQGEWKRVISYKIADVEYIEDAKDCGIEFSAISGGHNSRVRIYGVQLAGAPKDIAELVSVYRMRLLVEEAAELKVVLMAWIKKMEELKVQPKTAVGSFGWIKFSDSNGFAAGPNVFWDDDTMSPISGVDHSMVKEYTPIGSEAVWRSAASLMLEDQCHPITAAVLSAFAAPLILLTGVPGVMFSITSERSGTGKSSALRLAQAVWGDPRRGINSLNDTVLSIVKRLGYLNNLPAYWDEVRMRDEVENFVRMVFQLGQGKERSRLTTSARMQDMGTWATLITVATNEPVIDHVDEIVGNSNAGRLRVFEVEVPVRPMLHPELERHSLELNYNYGHIGAHYAKWIAKNYSSVVELVDKIKEKVRTDLGATNDERFWVAYVTVMLVAAILVNKLGYFHVELPEFKRWLYKEFTRLRREVHKVYAPIEERAFGIIIDFMDKHRDQVAVTEYVPTKPGRPGFGACLIQPRDKEILAVIGQIDRRIRIKWVPLKRWVYANFKQSPSLLQRQIADKGGTFLRASVSAGLANTVNGRAECVDLVLTDAEFASHLEEVLPDGL